MPFRKRKRPKHPERLCAKPKNAPPKLTEMFRQIWESRPHVCEKCGKVLAEARAHNFAHKKHRGKGGNPDGSRNAPDNILILCYECHTELDTGRRPHNAEWMDR